MRTTSRKPIVRKPEVKAEVTWANLVELIGEPRKNLMAYGSSAEVAYQNMTDIATGAGFESLEELVEACEGKIGVIEYLQELEAGVPEEEEEVEEPAPRRKAAPARREAPPQRGKPAAKSSKKVDTDANKKRMPRPKAGQLVGKGDGTAGDYIHLESDVIEGFAALEWEQVEDDEGYLMEDRLRTVGVKFGLKSAPQKLIVTVRQGNIGTLPERKWSQAIETALREGCYAIEFSRPAGVFFDCDVEITREGRDLALDENNYLVWGEFVGGGKEQEFFRGARKPADEGKRGGRTREPEQTFRSRGKARR